MTIPFATWCACAHVAHQLCFSRGIGAVQKWEDHPRRHQVLLAAAAMSSMLQQLKGAFVLAVGHFSHAQADLELYQHVSSSGAPPYFALSWLITWFSHNVPALEQITRLFDLFMASHPLMPLYVAVIAMRVSRLSTSLSCLSLCILVSILWQLGMCFKLGCLALMFTSQRRLSMRKVLRFSEHASSCSSSSSSDEALRICPCCPES